MADEDIFIRVTNKDIYKKLLGIEKTLEEVILHQKETNGKVKLNRFQLQLVWGLLSVIIIALIKSLV